MAAALQPFQERDFLAYERHRQDDPEYNALRLSVRRKLAGIAAAAKKQAQELGTELASQAGLHHPYTFNNYRVSEQRAYLCRNNRERKKLAAFFGEALGKDAETHYIQTVLEVCLDAEVLQVGLRIHPLAWWDGENLKKKVLEQDGMAAWCTMLKALPAGFAQKLHDWRKLYWAQVANEQEMREFFGSYTPGEHWLHLQRELPQEDVLEMGEEACRWAVTSLLALLPPYRFILWTP
ncbi:MAG: hypothetical protein ACYTGW_08275 [Planctomycetota bacterium]|jgi:hypothetical protein